MNNYVALGILSCLTYTVSFAQPEVSGSFHNLSKPSGGPVSTGDTIEIRAVISIPEHTNITRLRFTDLIPTGTDYIPNSIKAMTNEAVYGPSVANTGIYTDLAADDRATFITGTNIHLNLGDAAGTGTNAASGGNVTGGITVPRYQTRATIIQAAFSVRVTATAGQSIALGGSFLYRDAGSNDQVRNVPARSITILPELNCNGQSFTNLITAENGGTFNNGTAHVRGASANTFDFTYTPLSFSTPNDGEYSITKNSSPTQYSGATPALTDKVFGIWDIAGDHTGSLDGMGNTASQAGATGGYMLLVNASYAPNAIFNTTVNNLMPGTVYTLSFWVRNICSMCGWDPVSGNAVFAAGVKPNLVFAVNGEDLYTTGNLDYTGQWILKAFSFNSGPLTTANITIKNNAPGGGGNDWALDDISITTCIMLVPVTIEKFEAVPGNNGVVIQWKTGNEQQVEVFDVEYSDDGRVFYSAGSVGASGNNSKYSFNHQRKLMGKSFYRLRYRDLGGKLVYSKIVTTSRFAGDFQQFRLIQHNSHQLPQVSVFSETADLVELKLVDATGRQFAATQKSIPAGNSILEISKMGNPAPGIYFVHVKSGLKTTVIRCLVR